MAQKKNQNKQSGQLARQSQKSNNNNANSGTNQKASKNPQGPVSAPVAFSTANRVNPPKINTSLKSSRISHRELIGSVSGNTTFGASAYAVNPGLSATFPWLSSVAPSYEQYRFHRLRFHFVTRAATSYAGSVLLTPEYDALDATPTSEVTQAMMSGTCEDVPWRDQIMEFNVPDMFPLGPRKFVRTGSVANSDLKTYDAGQLFVGLASCADTSVIGKLWVEYDVELFIPQNPSTTGNVQIGSAALYTLHTAQTGIASGVATTVLFDTEVYDSIGASVSSGLITLPAGTYSVAASVPVVSTGTSDVTLELLKDGSSMANKIQTKLPNMGSVSASAVLFGWIVSTGSNTVSCKMTDASGGGTSSIAADTAQILITRIV